jgi:hypothetical protein
MNCLGCLARHVLMIYMEKVFRLRYMEELAAKYKVNFEELKQEVTKVHQQRKGDQK